LEDTIYEAGKATRITDNNVHMPRSGKQGMLSKAYQSARAEALTLTTGVAPPSTRNTLFSVVYDCVNGRVGSEDTREKTLWSLSVYYSIYIYSNLSPSDENNCFQNARKQDACIYNANQPYLYTVYDANE
jgi:hypothetical protein